MTNYSELSDMEIAERVARGMGFGPGRDCWFKLETYLHDISPYLNKWLFGPKKGEAYEFWLENLFFDWPAPLMMAKVKEMLVKLSYSCDIAVELKKSRISVLCTIYGAGDKEGFLAVRTHSEARALYETFLQVMEFFEESE